jgi:hypothetical protein
MKDRILTPARPYIVPVEKVIVYKPRADLKPAETTAPAGITTRKAKDDLQAYMALEKEWDTARDKIFEAKDRAKDEVIKAWKAADVSNRGSVDAAINAAEDAKTIWEATDVAVGVEVHLRLIGAWTQGHVVDGVQDTIKEFLSYVRKEIPSLKDI